MNNNKPLTGFDLPYSHLIDNIKAILIYLVVFNHLVAFALVKYDSLIRYIWYGITIFHMPAFVFVSGYLSKNRQSQYKNCKNLLIPYVLGYTFTWAATVWTEQSMAYDILRPSGTAMWYLLALYVYRSTIEAVSRVRFVVPLSMVFAIWAGTRPEFSTYLSVSRIVVFFPFFIAGYLWSNQTTQRLRTFKGKWVLFFLSATVLTMMPVYMISQQIPIDLLRENHGYLMSGVSNQVGITLRLLMFLASFIVIITLLALVPDFKTPLSFLGRNTMSIYFIHYPLLIALNGMKVFRLPSLMNGPANALMSLAIVLVLGAPPVHWLYSICMSLIAKIILRPNRLDEEGSLGYLQDEYDNDDYFSYVSYGPEEEQQAPAKGASPSPQAKSYGGGSQSPGGYQGGSQSSYQGSQSSYQSNYQGGYQGSYQGSRPKPSQGSDADYPGSYDSVYQTGYSDRIRSDYQEAYPKQPLSGYQEAYPKQPIGDFQGGYPKQRAGGYEEHPADYSPVYDYDYEDTFRGPHDYLETNGDDYEDIYEDTFQEEEEYPVGAKNGFRGYMKGKDHQ